MKTRYLKIITGMALGTVLELTVAPISAFAQSAQEQRGIEGVWDARISVVQCDTGKVISTGGRAMLMFINGGGLTVINPDFRRTTSLGTWRHLRGRNYTAVNRFFTFNADDSFAGTQATTVDIDLSSNADEYTATATFEFFDPADQLIRAGCATSTATRLE
jgi:hypothetical protein